MGTRTSRKKLSKNKAIDTTKPLDFAILGGEDDPCFGKHHDPNAKECKICGDAEICSIVFAQKLNVDRKLIESKNSFKDIQNLTCTWKELSKAIRGILKKHPKGLPLPTVKTKAINKLNIHESDFDKLLKKILEKNSKYTFNKTSKQINFKWK